MAVKIRLHRMGRKKRPFYRIVATDSRTRRDGKYLENLGTYNPIVEPAEVFVEKEKVFKWLKVGAIPSDTVRNLLSKQGIMFEWDLIQRGLDQEQIAQEKSKWDAEQEKQQKRIEAKNAMLKRQQEEEVKKAKPEKAESKPAPESEPADEAETQAEAEPKVETEDQGSAPETESDAEQEKPA
ncbi:30S ribosomal protein S16 [candidate division KSB1 bacterium]|nr:30S ribosomal protein S16 [candidate division KSB1 bacterium]